MYKLDDHIACVVAGITGKARPLKVFRASGSRDGPKRAWCGSRRDPVLCCPIPSCAADANILINTCRLSAQRYMMSYQEPIPIEQLVRNLCDTKQVTSAQRPPSMSH